MEVLLVEEYLRDFLEEVFMLKREGLYNKSAL